MTPLIEVQDTKLNFKVSPSDIDRKQGVTLDAEKTVRRERYVCSFVFDRIM